MGAKSKLKAGQGGTLNRRAPAGDRDGKVSRQRRGKPPRQRVIRRPLFRCARVQPPGTCTAGIASAAPRPAPGMQGAKPLA